jgi:hypothetical protein
VLELSRRQELAKKVKTEIQPNQPSRCPTTANPALRNANRKLVSTQNQPADRYELMNLPFKPGNFDSTFIQLNSTHTGAAKKWAK